MQRPLSIDPTISNFPRACMQINTYSGFTSVIKTCHIFFVSLTSAGIWLSFNGHLASLFSLLYVIRECDRFLHRR